MSAPDRAATPKVERAGKVTIITFTAGAIRDVENVLARELGGSTTEIADHHLLLDLGNVTYLNSVELGTLISLHKRMAAAGGRLTLFNLSPLVLSVFTTCHLDTLLSICQGVEEARGNLTTPGTTRAST